jgi:aminocarboxymuconate-semialdehyde decarboxylase
MSTRRQFLTHAAGLCFVGCGIAGHAHAHALAGTRRREVMVGGKRARTIDVHAHCQIPAAMQVAGDRLPKPLGVILEYPGLYQVADERLASMDAQGIDMQALSCNPYWYKFERDVVEKMIDVQNEALAGFCAAHPDRFIAFASLALQYPDLAVQQLERAMKKYNLRGVAIGGSVGDAEFSDPKFHPIWAKCEEMGAVLFIHPQGTPELTRRLKGNGLLVNVIGNPLDTTIALSHLIFEGTLDKFPGLKIIAAHGGGYIGSYAPRNDHGCLVFPDQCDPNIKLKKKPTEYLRDIYVDNIVFTPEMMRHLNAEIGYDRVLVGSDFPYPWEIHAVDVVMKAPGATDAQKVAMLGGTAAKLLGVDRG